MPRKYRRVPGLGLVPGSAEYDIPDYDYEEFELPQRMGVPSDPRVRAWKREVMKRSWQIFRSGRARSMSEAMKRAYAEVPHPGGYKRRRRY